MLIYAVADIHGRQKKMDRIRENLMKIRPQVLLAAGDLTGWKSPERTISWLNDLALPVLVVRGNADRGWNNALFAPYPNVEELHVREKNIDGFQFVGVGGTIPIPFHSRLAFKEKLLLQKLELMVDNNTVLIAHPPPWGYLDQAFGRFHAGSKGLRNLILKKNPALVFCGHIHERPGTLLVQQTMVVNCSVGRRGRGAVIELEKGKTARVEFI